MNIRNQLAFGGSGLDTETKNYIFGLTTPLSGAEKNKINNLVKSIKSLFGVNSLSTVFDLLYIDAGETREQSYRNLAKNAYHRTATGTPVFEANKGLIGSVGNYLKTGFIPSTHASAASLNSISIGAYVRESIVAGELKIPIGTYSTSPATLLYVMPSYANKLDCATNSLAFQFTYKQTYPGLYAATRRSATEVESFINYYKSIQSIASVGLPTKEVYSLARNVDGTVGNNFTKQVSFEFIGKGMTEAQLYGLIGIFNTYLGANSVVKTSIGIIGDSITDIQTTTFAWPSNFLQTQYTVAPFGVTGHSIVLNLANDAALLTSNGYDKIIITHGTNDNNAGSMATLRTIVDNAISAIKANCPKATIYYMNVLPRWTDAGGGTIVDKSNIRAMIHAACIANNITEIDTFTDPWIAASDTVDGTHPSSAGALKIYNKIITAIA